MTNLVELLNRYRRAKTAGMFLLFTVAQLTSTFTHGQQHTFSADRYLLAEEIVSFFRESAGQHRQPLTDAASRMRHALTEGYFSDNQVIGLSQVANRMLQLKLPAYPSFFYYFQSTLGILKFPGSDLRFDEWNKGVIMLLNEPETAQFDLFLSFSNQFFKEHTLYEDNSVRWAIRNGSWRFSTGVVPLLIVEGADLIGETGADSSVIRKASGTYNPFGRRWSGHSGLVTWERAAMSSNLLHASLGSYFINMQSSGFNADTAWLHYPGYFSKPVPGTLHEQASQGIIPSASTYPKFTSFETSLHIKDIFPGIDFTGGIALEGKRVEGFGAFRNDAVLLIHYQDRPVVRLTSRSFTLRSDRITSQRAAATIYFCGDSIVHPGLEMRYMHNNSELTLLRSKTGLPSSPHFNSYHDIDMYVEAIYWNIASAEMKLGGIRGSRNENEAVFESKYYFTPSRFYQLQGIDEYHPLIAVNDFARRVASDGFYVEELATFMGIAIAQVSTMLIHLAASGFVFYNPENGKIVVKERLNHYLNAFNRKKDHDVIRIVSQVTGTVNAVLNIENCSLTVKGVPEVMLSNTQRVNIYPARSEIVITKNLGIEFSGNIRAGYFDFYIGPGTFDYSSFSLLLPQVDSLSFVVPVEAMDKPTELIRVKTVISDISGELSIGHHENKSGRINQPQFPAFRSKTDSYVYFDQMHVQHGVYSKERFYYHVLPFEIDSLHSFTTVGMSFNGYLYSGGIIPEISEPLRVQPDFSLGFQTSSPLTNVPVYEGAGHFTGSLSLSHNGLVGSGTITYLNTSMEANSWIYHPDSLMATLDNFAMTETPGSPEFPAVMVQNAALVWKPASDLAVLTNNPAFPFLIFNHQVTLCGTLQFGSDGLYASGTARWKQATWQSHRYSFTRNSMSAEWSDFAIQNEPDGLIFRSTGYGFNFELLTRQGKFFRKTDEAVVVFPINNYITRCEAFRWEADYNEVHLNNETTAELLNMLTRDFSNKLPHEVNQASFLSMQPDQDSLRFFAATAHYDMRNFEITAFDVPYIHIADAVIIPAGGNITVRNDGTLNPLHDSEIFLDPENQLHSFADADVKIHSSRAYTASGNLIFESGIDDKSEIFFSEIKTDSAGITHASAQIYGAGMLVNPYFRFKGSIYVGGAEPHLFFDGYFKPTEYFSGYNPKWVRFASRLQSNNITFPAAFPMTGEAGENIYATLIFNASTGKLYPAFFAPEIYQDDTALIAASGFIGYDAVERNVKHFIHRFPTNIIRM